MQTVRPRPRSALLMALGLTSTALAAIGTVTVLSTTAVALEPEPGPLLARTVAKGGLAAEQRYRADQLISAFENSSTAIQYQYAENLHDGRGVTAGRAGFCTGTGDALMVVQRYAQRVPQRNPLARFLPELRRLASSGSDDTSRLPEADYIGAWQAAASDHRFRSVQDELVDELYFNPAMRHADAVGLRTALARAQVYDATVQHGDGTDPDSVGALLRRTAALAGGTPATGVDERVWLQRFFQVRIANLRAPANGGTAEEWAASVDRVAAMQRIAATGNYDLYGPVRFSVYGDDFTID